MKLIMEGWKRFLKESSSHAYPAGYGTDSEERVAIKNFREKLEELVKSKSDSFDEQFKELYKKFSVDLKTTEENRDFTLAKDVVRDVMDKYEDNSPEYDKIEDILFDFLTNI